MQTDTTFNLSTAPPQLWQAPAYTGTAQNMGAKTLDLQQRLVTIAKKHARVLFASSLGAEDMVLTDAMLRLTLDKPIGIFTLETGRLHAETRAVLDAVKTQYGYTIASYTPQEVSVVQFVKQYGLNGFYDGLEQRKACCQIRKIEPLNRALKDADAWLTGQRREQSVTRGELDLAEHDGARNIAKYNPLFDWSEAEVWQYLKQNRVPTNALHQKGYPSIGCEPCTRAIREGENVRAGRWWWENKDSKECGLHVAAAPNVADAASALDTAVETKI